ncbi:energy transducer TonB [Pseudoalteromonas sp. MMG013]|jgi:protein TonB|uniref:Protein TonB n=1 Tax=Pseudoalteromonas aurantia 208 TaxID=1314867 RepID=A0ABR9EEM6_9GAMM|nr:MULTISPECIES: energy transducer TonB [Pseudoalteromonas]MBE0368720.1 periplasmic protein TonB [Pseudoalteromonas aurantia 208]MBQ4847964.1 energy transducer TonB [Pseudoalteromonas sp. MMG005]MBQ4849511.1 energy transducer TonB [Pseudoalteromonas sp. MMG012]MBQ4863774.1 energy transducer TonB [Pseudoalteromonas sp. MMG013]
MIRFLFSLIAGGAVTFGLFFFMSYLISGGADRSNEQKEQIVVEILTNPPESEVQERKRVPPPPPPPPKQPPKPQPPQPENANPAAGAIGFNMPSINLGGTAGGLSGPGAFGRDGDATPIVRIEPKYPTQAARDGKEGWVQLSFTINELGGVDDVKVIAAEPKRIFNREAIRALRKWKYRPKIVDGKPLVQPGLTVQLDFKLNQD